jgi:hypothetical protein
LGGRISELINGADDQGLLDTDSVIAKHCAATGEPEPENVDDRQQLHLKLLYDVLANLEDKDDQGSSKASEPAAWETGDRIICKVCGAGGFIVADCFDGSLAERCG